MNAVAGEGEGEGNFYAGCWSRCSTFSVQPGPSITFQSLPQVHQMAGVLVTGMQTSRISPQEEEKTNSTRLRAGWLAAWDTQALIVLISAFSTDLNLSVCVRVCVCVWVVARKLSTPVVPCGLSASLEVKGEWPGRG
jgi:hypothetical protein